MRSSPGAAPRSSSSVGRRRLSARRHGLSRRSCDVPRRRARHPARSRTIRPARSPESPLPPMPRRLPDPFAAALLARLGATQGELARRFPGPSGRRQPVHTVYGGAHLFTRRHRGAARRARAAGARRVRARRRDARRRARPRRRRARARRVYARVAREAARASRSRTSASTSRTATATAPTPRRTATPTRPRARSRPGSRRARCRRSSASASSRSRPSSRARSLRTLDLFLTTLARRDRRPLPPNFVVTLPKITHPEQVAALGRRARRARARARPRRRRARGSSS